MKIIVNGAWRELNMAAEHSARAAPTLEAVLSDLGFGASAVATAINGEFVAVSARARTAVKEGDRVEVLAPMQGG